MKLKALAKEVAKEMGEEKISSKLIKQWIKDSSKFSLDGKIVSLAGKKRGNESPQTVVTKKPKLIEDDGDDDDNVKETSGSSDNDSDKADNGSIQDWRNKNKIVVKHATDDAALADELNSKEMYFPFSTFDSKECKAAVVAPLLRQCTEGNGFTKPSPIQAQSWPILLGKTPKDIVGIAETGKLRQRPAFCATPSFPNQYYSL